MGRLQRWWRGRLGLRFLREAILVAALYALYKLGRTLSRDEVGIAFRHARHVLSLEHSLGIGNERSLQRIALDHLWAVKALNRYYVTVHFPLSVTFLVYFYIRHPDSYRGIRRLFTLTTASALIIHVLYPLAPPRLLPGFVDTVTVWGPSVYDNASLTAQANQLAAMPSLHFAWAVLVAYGVIVGSSMRLRWLIVIHPFMTLTAIIITGNHYWLDAIVGAVLVVLSWAAERRFGGDRGAVLFRRQIAAGAQPDLVAGGWASR